VGRVQLGVPGVVRWVAFPVGIVRW